MAERKLKWDKLIGLSEEEINKKAREILSLMTIKEKTWQMVGDGELGIECGHDSFPFLLADGGSCLTSLSKSDSMR